MGFGASFTGVTFFQPPFATGARNGASVDAAGNVVLGNDLAAAGSPAQFLNSREILTNGFLLALFDGLLPADLRSEFSAGFLNFFDNAGTKGSVISPGNTTLSDSVVGGNIILDQAIALAAELRYMANVFTMGAQGQPFAQLHLPTGNFVIGQTIADNGEKLQVDGHVSMLSATANLDFPNTAAQTSNDLTIPLAGAVVGDMVVLGFDPAGLDADSCYTAFVDAAGSVTVRFNNYSAAAIDPAARDFAVSVFKPF